MGGLPRQGLSKEVVLAALARKRDRDVRWQDGRTFGMVFDGGPALHDVVAEAALMFLHDNALNTSAFPSVREIQSEVVGMCADLFHEAGASGFMTSGGTESILMAVKAARERGREERGITAPEMVLAESAHAAFHKAAHYFGITVRKTKVTSGYRADPATFAEAINGNTVLVVGSAPQYPQGVIDPIEDLAALAAEAGANFHADACMGGFVLPFMEMLGEPVPPWDFRVAGVTSISADLHKLGYAPKGASVVLHRTKELRRYQTFVFDDWLGGLYASPNMQGSRPALPMACAWAALHFLGEEGYLSLTRTTIDAARKMAAGINAIAGLEVLAEPEAHILAFAGTAGTDVFSVGDAMTARGWFHDRQRPPESLHATVSAGNALHIDAYLADLREAVAAVSGLGPADRSTSYATLE